jgi:hypothetical protein
MTSQGYAAWVSSTGANRRDPFRLAYAPDTLRTLSSRKLPARGVPKSPGANWQRQCRRRENITDRISRWWAREHSQLAYSPGTGGTLGAQL